MNATRTASKILTVEHQSERAKDSAQGRSVAEIILMFPAAALGIIIGAYPISLPILYLIVVSLLG